MKVILLDRKLFGHMENMKVQADLNEVCCILNDFVIQIFSFSLCFYLLLSS